MKQSKKKPKKALVNSIWAFALIFLIALGLRMNGLSLESMFLDEAYMTMAEISGTKIPDFLDYPEQPFLFRMEVEQDLGKLLSVYREADPLCPPLYPVLLNRWLVLNGVPLSDDYTIRILSVIFSMAALAATYFLVSSAFGRKAALFTAVIIAFAPFDIHIAQQARMYSLVLLTTVISCMSMLHIIRHFNQATISRGRIILLCLAYVVSTCALINSHYTGLFIVGFQGLYGIAYSAATRNMKLFITLSLSWISIVLLWLPWLHMFLVTADNRHGGWFVDRAPSLWWPFVSLLKMPTKWIDFMNGGRVVAYAIPIYASACLFIVLAALASLRNRNTRAEDRDSGDVVPVNDPPYFMWCWLVIPFLALWCVDIIECRKVCETHRYILYTAPALYILVGCGLAYFWNRKTWLKWVLAAHIVFALGNYSYSYFAPRKEPWRQVAQKVDQIAKADDPIFVADFFNVVCLDRYMKRPMRQYGLSANLGQDYFNNKLKDWNRFWLVTAQKGEESTALIPKRFKVKQHHDFSRGVHLRLYEAQ